MSGGVAGVVQRQELGRASAAPPGAPPPSPGGPAGVGRCRAVQQGGGAGGGAGRGPCGREQKTLLVVVCKPITLGPAVHLGLPLSVVPLRVCSPSHGGQGLGFVVSVCTAMRQREQSRSFEQ